MALTEAEDLKKRWQEYTEELYQKDFNDPDNHDDVITHLKPDILECEVKWALGSITTNKDSGGDWIPVDSNASKEKLKILQARLQQYMNWEIPDVQAGFRKGRGTRDQIATIH